MRIVDFGAAKIVGGSKLTRPGVVFGTPYYMSPEQAGGQPVDARADVYSLGVLLYEMITGAVPFEADTYMGVLTKHLFAAPAKPSERAPSGVQLGELEGVVLRALEKDPNERYQSMTEFAAAIERASEGRPSEAPEARRRGRLGRIAFIAMSTADKIERSVARQLVEERPAEAADAARHRRRSRWRPSRSARPSFSSPGARDPAVDTDGARGRVRGLAPPRPPPRLAAPVGEPPASAAAAASSACRCMASGTSASDVGSLRRRPRLPRRARHARSRAPRRRGSRAAQASAPSPPLRPRSTSRVR